MILSIPLSALVLILSLPRTRSERFWRLPETPATTELSAENQKQSWTDRFGNGTPDFLRLPDPTDQAAFRRWFVVIAEYQAVRPPADVPAEIADCASLLRYSYREALKRHDDRWFVDTKSSVAYTVRRTESQPRWNQSASTTRSWFAGLWGMNNPEGPQP